MVVLHFEAGVFFQQARDIIRVQVHGTVRAKEHDGDIFLFEGERRAAERPKRQQARARKSKNALFHGNSSFNYL